MARTYEFLSSWHIPALPFEALTILSDETQLPFWWPSAFLRVRRIHQGEELGIGRTADVLARGFLTHTLRWRISVTDVSPDKDGFSVRVIGDLNGTGVRTARPERGGCKVSLHWKVQVGRTLLKRLEWLIWPLFHANHHWAMHHGERSMSIEVSRRRGKPMIEKPPVPLTMNFLAGTYGRAVVYEQRKRWGV